MFPARSTSKVGRQVPWNERELTERQKNSRVYGVGVEAQDEEAERAYAKCGRLERVEVVDPLRTSRSVRISKSAKTEDDADSRAGISTKQVYTDNEETPALIVYNVSKSYKLKDKTIEANRGVNLVARRGEVVGVLGPNGSGKSTLCKAIAMTHNIDAGDILVDKCSVREDPNAVLYKIGVCAQDDAGLFDTLTVGEHLELFSEVCTEKSKINVLEELGLKEYVQKRASELSGGWKRRLSIGCALVHDPQVLILDEVTSGVDAVAREELWALLKRICVGKTIIATTHTLHEAQEYFDRVNFFVGGKIVCTGTKDELVNMFKDSVSVEVRGLLGDDFFAKMAESGIQISGEQSESQTVQNLEEKCSDNIDVLFAELSEREKRGEIGSFALTQRQFEQIFFELLKLSE